MKKLVTDSQLINTAVKSMSYSHSPHSNFKVGAAILSEDGKIFSGTNIEFDAYTLTVCAERAALFSAVSNGVKNIKKVVIATNSSDFKYPCGLCRQALSEFNSETEIMILNNKKKIKRINLKKLLPNSFKL